MTRIQAKFVPHLAHPEACGNMQGSAILWVHVRTFDDPHPSEISTAFDSSRSLRKHARECDIMRFDSRVALTAALL
jgi:hypothetical protein